MLAIWYAVGVIGSFVAGILLPFEAPLGFSMGNFGSPATVSWLERRRVWSPEWDLLLAIAYQQGGQKQRAEQLYRGLPQFAESWNNLGVILKEAGKEQEARQAFEQALQRDPGLAEAALNLGRPPQSLWTEHHQKYLPDRPMIAPPSQERIRNAMLGGPPLRVYVRALWMGFRYFSAVGKLAG